MTFTATALNINGAAPILLRYGVSLLDIANQITSDVARTTDVPLFSDHALVEPFLLPLEYADCSVLMGNPRFAGTPPCATETLATTFQEQKLAVENASYVGDNLLKVIGLDSHHATPSRRTGHHVCPCTQTCSV